MFVESARYLFKGQNIVKKFGDSAWRKINLILAHAFLQSNKQFSAKVLEVKNNDLLRKAIMGPEQRL